MASLRHWEQDKEATVYIGGLDERVTDSLVWELMLQAGRIQNVHLPKDRVTQVHQGFGFVEFLSEEDAEYAAKIMNQVRLFGRAIRVNKASADKQKAVEVGAELFIGNLDGMVDERTLYDTFGRFGTLTCAPKVARDEANISKGYGFVSFADFEAADTAIANMNGQYLMNKEISVQYAYKKDGKGERHGDEAERRLASQARQNNVQPNVQPLAAHLFQAPQSMAPPLPQQSQQQPPAMSMPPAGYPPPPQVTAYTPQPALNGYGPPPGQFQPQPPQQQHHHQHPHQQNHYGQYSAPPPPPRAANQTPLPPPPSGLPARPPPSAVGYGGPPNLMPGGPPGFQSSFPPPGPPPPQQFGAAPPGFGAPPPGYGVPPPEDHLAIHLEGETSGWNCSGGKCSQFFFRIAQRGVLG